MTLPEARKWKRAAPYVPASAMSAFFDHIRYVKTPDKVDSNLVQDYGITPGQAFALLSTLKFLGLTEDDGTPTPAFKLLQTGGDEFKSSLREILQRAYSDLFSRLDVSRDSQDKILNFFARNYSPATAVRATRLFLDLCGEAGIEIAAKEPSRRPRGRKTIKEDASKEHISTTEDKVPPVEEPKPEGLETGKKPLVPMVPAPSGVTVRIDSKDLVSMNHQQIQAVFEGLGKIMKHEKESEK